MAYMFQAPPMIFITWLTTTYIIAPVKKSDGEEGRGREEDDDEGIEVDPQTRRYDRPRMGWGAITRVEISR